MKQFVVLAAMIRGSQILFFFFLVACNNCYSSYFCFGSFYYFGYCRCLFIRFSRFGYWLNVILLLLYGLTVFLAGLGANCGYDLRNIIALSTLRLLGLMVL
jgi:NADH-ubiquinone oxidoreductase chain 5